MADYDERGYAVRYAPRTRPTPIPVQGAFDAPSVCVTINAAWVSHIIGTMEAMDQPDTWIGSPEQIELARQTVREIMLALRQGNCDEMPFDIRQKPDEPCIIQKTNDGVNWVDAVDLNLCAPSSVKPPLEFYDDVRVNPETGAPEVSFDGGTTWTPAPTGSTWTPARSPSPGMTQEEQVCAAASRVAYNMSEFYRNTYGASTAGVMNSINTFTKYLTSINNVLAGIVFPQATAILKAFGFLEEYDPDDYSAPLLSEDARQALTCLLIEHGTVGAYQVVSFDFEAVRDNVISELGANPGFAVWTHFNYLGEEGINRFGDIGFYNTDDCVQCEDPEFALEIVPDWGGTLTYDPVTQFWTISGGTVSGGHRWAGVQTIGGQSPFFFIQELEVLSGVMETDGYHCSYRYPITTTCNSPKQPSFSVSRMDWRSLYNNTGAWSMRFKAVGA